MQQLQPLKEKLYFVWYSVGILVLFAVVMWVLSFFKHLITLLTVSILLAYILEPLVKLLTNPLNISLPKAIRFKRKNIRIPWKFSIKTKKGLPRLLSVGLVFCFVTVLLVLVTFYLLPIVTQEFNNLYGNRFLYYETVIEWINNLETWFEANTPKTLKPYLPDISRNIPLDINEYINKAATHSFPFVKNVMSHIALIFLMPLVTFYILMDVEIYKKSFIGLIPAKKKSEVASLIKQIDLILQKYVRGQLLVCFIIGVSVTVVLMIMDIPYAVLIGVFAGIIDAIPYIGVIVGMVPAVWLALLKSPLHALLVLVVLYIVHWSEGHIVIPNIMGQSVGLPPLTVIVALIIGAQIMGILGMFLAVPVASIIRVIVNFYVKKRQEEEEQRNAVDPK